MSMHFVNSQQMNCAPSSGRLFYNSFEQWTATGLSTYNVSWFPSFTWEEREQRAWAAMIQRFVAFSGEPGELLPGCLVTPRYSFRQTPRSIPEVGCQHAPVPLKCGSSSPHQVVSELLRVKPEKRGPPAAPAWAWRSGEGWKILRRANRGRVGAHWFNSLQYLPQRVYKM